MIVYLNGDFVEAGARINIADRGFTLGDGAFETLYAENGRCAFLMEHLARLHRGLSILKIETPLATAEIADIIGELARRNGLANKRASVRVTISRGAGARGLVLPAECKPTILITIAPAPAPRPTIIRLQLAKQQRFTGASTASFKSISGYAENVLALSDAIEAGADDAVLLNEFGRVACASSANLFLIEAGGAVVTPPVTEGAMPGIVRDALIAGAAEHSVVTTEQSIAAERLPGAFLFLSNSLRGLQEAAMADAAPEVCAPQRKSFQALQTWYQDRLRSDISAETTRS